MEDFIKIFVCLFCLFSCSTGNTDEKQRDEDIEILRANTCFRWESNGSLADFQITEVGDNIVGSLSYFLAEKDKNIGKFSGKVEGNLLIGSYVFQSEGLESVREVAFLIKPDTLIEGFGAVEEDGNSMKFVNPAQLDYTSGMVLIAVDCDVRKSEDDSNYGSQ